MWASGFGRHLVGPDKKRAFQEISGDKTHVWETKGKLQNSELEEDESTPLFYRLRNRDPRRFKDLAKVSN